MVLGGLLAGTCAFCALAALFGGLETESFGEQLSLFVIFLILMCVGTCVLIEGRWVKNGKKQKKSTAQVKTKTKLPPASEDQRRLEEIDRNIDSVAGTIQANPMSPGRVSDEEHLRKLQQEKHARLKRIAAHSEKITVQDAWNIFTPEQQKRFDAQVYQYSQDVGRDGVLPREVYAENRGLVFVDGRPVPKEVAARLKELRKAAEVEKKMENTMVKAFDYPVPFTELLIYPNRIVKRSSAAQVLLEEGSASYGTLFEGKVSLCEENGRHRLTCEKQERSEHGSQYDLECSMSALLSMQPEQQHYLPLTKWILSLQWKNLRQYTDEVCVRQPVAPAEHLFKQYRRIKESRMNYSHDQPGWNCTYDEIGLGFDSPDVWHLCRTSHWREAPSGLPYNVTIKMRLRPGAEKKSDETLCGLMDSLPWWGSHFGGQPHVGCPELAGCGLASAAGRI